ncbi:PREDICTED: KH domain-containing protein At4g18375 [Brassica oleracea var. oleracea]|uniref:K Homology domain-containing protein n=1 Tax=Brassica oleracea var. oleracea TaxID=109376 RepID=A0A0D3A429_BRAOL|nr:PREDICTED: KH domain-containing protein At4g18375 [Brassica oleracea var. oleracea]XP_013620920.1 PREDICTED: KH domain-containing protein At4g18375 [Brassica oleracea var. oleracea]
MSDRKKRKSNHNNNNNDYKNQRRRFSNANAETINKEDLVIYRILCPVGIIGGVIGKSGKVINAIRDTTKAKIKVFDQSPGCTQRVITIYSSVKEKVDVTETETEPLCCAQDALLRVHDTIVSCVESAAGKKTEECRLLVPSSQASGVIGKAGAVIKSIRRRTGASVEVDSKHVSDPSHACALDFDNVVLISGEHKSVKKALYAVSATMYKTNPREQIPLDSTTVQDTPASVIVPSDLSSYVYHSAGVPTFVNASEFQGFAETTSPASHGFGGSPGSKELVLKVLCPVSRIGRVIGREGSTIKGMREASGSRIEVNKANHGDDECVIIVTATESPDDMKSMAVEAILLLQEKISDDIDEETVKMQLPVPSKVIGCVIGKSGSVINQIRKRTNANIRISKGNNDDLVEVSGEVSSVRDALIQIVLRLREDVLGDRGSVSARNPPAARSDHSGFTLAPFVSSVPEYASVDFDQRRETGESSLGMVSSDRFYGYESSFPARDHGLVSVGPYSYGGLYQSSALEILVPASAVSKVIGKGGGNLENIRRISGAMVEVSDSKTSHGDRIALVSGTPEQMRSAENLFQAFIMST